MKTLYINFLISTINFLSKALNNVKGFKGATWTIVPGRFDSVAQDVSHKRSNNKRILALKQRGYFPW